MPRNSKGTPELFERIKQHLRALFDLLPSAPEYRSAFAPPTNWRRPIFVVCSILLALCAGLAALSDRAFMQTAQYARGTVVSKPFGSGSHSEVEFKTRSGQLVTVRISTSEEFAVGEWVGLLYDPAEPDAAQVDSKAERYRTSIVLLTLSLGLGVAGLISGIKETA